MGKDIIRIVLADAQYLTRAGLHYLFAGHPQIEVVGEAADMDELSQLIPQRRPHVLLMDYHNGSEFQVAKLEQLLRDHPALSVMLITDDQDKIRIRQVLALGINCILTKQCSPGEIAGGVVAVAKGEKFYCHKVLEIIMEKDDSANDCSPSNLSTREIEIIKLITSGLTTQEIADQLFLSTHTIYTHRKNIMKKLQINSVSEMILYAMNSGINFKATT